jgi:hypothetical protein
LWRYLETGIPPDGAVLQPQWTMWNDLVH